VLINLPRNLVLLPVHLRFFGGRELASIGRAVGTGFRVEGRFFRFQVRGFAGGQLAALHALRDAVLLVFLTFPDFGFRLGIGSGILRQGDGSGNQKRSRQNAPLLPLKGHNALLFVLAFPGLLRQTLACAESFAATIARWDSFFEGKYFSPRL